MTTRCETCREWLWYKPETHKCKPIYYVIHEDYSGDELIEIRGSDHEEAAEKYAEKYDQDDHDLLERGDQKVAVRDSKGTEKKFSISAEANVDYSAREITD